MVRSGYGAEMAHSCFDHRLHPGYRNGRVEPDSIGRLDEFDICGKLVDDRSRSRQRVLEYSDRGRSNSDIGIVHGCHCFVEQHHTPTTTAPRAPSTPTTAAPSVTVRPMTPGGGSIAPTTVAPPTAAPLSIPPVAVTPAIVEPPACSSYRDCAQKLFNAWQSSDRDAKTQALNFGTREAVNALFYVRSIGVTWDPTVRRSTALKYVATGTVTATGWEDRGSKSIEFVFTRGQSGYKVQSVEFF